MKKKSLLQREYYPVVGNADEGKLRELQDAGLVVQVLGETDSQGRLDAPQPETPGSGAAPLAYARRPTTVGTRSIAIEDAEDTIDLKRSNFYLVTLTGPLLEEYRSRLADKGIKFVEAYNDNSYSTYLSQSQVIDLGKMEFVAKVQLYGASQTVPAATEGLHPWAAPARRGLLLCSSLTISSCTSQTVFPPSKSGSMTTMSRSRVPRSESRGFWQNRTLQSSVSSPTCPKWQASRSTKPKLWNDLARQLLKLEVNPTPPLPYDGAGEIVAVADTGIDDKHPDFAGRIVGIAALGRVGLSDDPVGHGTHVAGSVLGDGKASQGTYRGIAPAAKLYLARFQRRARRPSTRSQRAFPASL